VAGATVQIMGKASEERCSVRSAPPISPGMTVPVSPGTCRIHLPSGPLKQIGDFEIPVSLHAEVNFKIIVSVIAEKTEK
jgi:hypothetical protein